MIIANRGIAATLAAMCMAAAGLILTSTPALAGTGTGLIGTFGSAGTGPGQFEQPQGIAVSSESGDVYVADAGNHRVERFSSTGSYLGQFEAPPGGFAPYLDVSVDNSGETPLEDPSVGDVYVLDGQQPRVDKFSATGAYLGSITEVEGNTFGGLFAMAVGPDGDLWVWESDFALLRCSAALSNRCETYGEMGSGSSGPGALLMAIDSEENIYVPSSEDGLVEFGSLAPGEPKFFEGNEWSAGFVCKCTLGIAVAPSTNRVYIDQPRLADIAEFEAFSKEFGVEQPISVFGGKALADEGGRGIAVAPAGTIYMADEVADRVDIFGQGATPEAPQGEAATGVTGSSAVLHGELNPGAKSTVGWYLAYNSGNSCTGGARTSSEPEADVQAEQVSQEIGGLEPSTRYTFCLAAENGFGPTFSSEMSFETAGIPPAVSGESASASDATLHAMIDPNNQATTCRFEYGSEATLAQATGVPCTPAELGEGNSAQSASVQLGELPPGATYYYRVIAENTSGERGEGAVQSFTTSSLPRVTTGETLETTRGTATLSGSVNTGHGSTTYRFLYIAQAGYEAVRKEGAANPYAGGESTPEHPLEAGEGSQSVEPQTVQGLLPDTTYHYALQASNVAGTTTGADATFTTGAATPPIVLTGTATGITFSAATLSATVQTEALDVDYAFEISTEPNSYGSPSGAGTVVSSAKEATVTMAVQGLRAGTTYYYRALATNADGTTYGAGGSFTTAGFPSQLTVPVSAVLLPSPELAFPTETGTGGNTTTKKLAKKCAKGKKRKHGRCVKLAKSKPTKRGRKK